MISQTGGCCRATNYIGMIRKALTDANLGDVPILSQEHEGGMNKQPGLPAEHRLPSTDWSWV